MTWVLANADQIGRYALTHAWLSALPVLLGFLLAFPLGVLAHRSRLARGPLLGASGLLYAVPSLPLFVVMPSLLGTTILDPLNVVVAMTLYAVALLVRTVSDALAAVDGDVLASATAQGHSAVQRFWRVEVPLAGPLVLAGLRVVSASTISLLSVGALIGVPSLGYFFTDGYARLFPTEILVGLAATVLLALLFDGALVLLGRLLMPWTRGSRRSTGSRRPRNGAEPLPEAVA